MRDLLAGEEEAGAKGESIPAERNGPGREVIPGHLLAHGDARGLAIAGCLADEVPEIRSRGSTLKA